MQIKASDLLGGMDSAFQRFPNEDWVWTVGAGRSVVKAIEEGIAVATEQDAPFYFYFGTVLVSVTASSHPGILRRCVLSAYRHRETSAGPCEVPARQKEEDT